MTPSPIPRWHEIVRSHDAAALPALLADDVVFESPVVHTPQPGKAVTLQYLGAAMHVFNNSSFRYVNEWHGPHSAVLEFETTCDGIAVNGVDMIAWNGDGLITHPVAWAEAADGPANAACWAGAAPTQSAKPARRRAQSHPHHASR